MTDVGIDERGMLSALEAIATGRAKFNIRAPVETTSHDGDTPGSSATNALDSANAPPAPLSGDSAQSSASNRGDQEDAGGCSAGGFGGDVGGGAAEEGLPSRYNPAALKYRMARIIDCDIMGSVVAEVRPLAGPGAGAIHDYGDAREVFGPEMEWKLSAEHGGEADVDAGIRDLVKIVKESGDEGLSLALLRSAVAGKTAGVSALGHALRSGMVVCLCGTDDVRWVGCLGGSCCTCVSS